LDTARTPLRELTCKQCSTTVKDDELLPTNIVQGYSAPGSIRLFTSPLIIASKHPVCESWDLKRRSRVSKPFMIQNEPSATRNSKTLSTRWGARVSFASKGLGRGRKRTRSAYTRAWKR
jgi:hypothetical protein